MLQNFRRLVLRAGDNAALLRFFSSGWVAKAEALPPHNPHQSNAEELVAKVPVIEVKGHVAMCDGGGGAMGHPVEYMQLDKKDGRSIATCLYCGLRYRAAAGSHH